jgi:hypothetical protein
VSVITITTTRTIEERVPSEANRQLIENAGRPSV